jgi:hypothetical protein
MTGGGSDDDGQLKSSDDSDFRERVDRLFLFANDATASQTARENIPRLAQASARSSGRV